MVEWQFGRYLDRGVWNDLRPMLNPRLIRAPSFELETPPNIRELQLEDSVEALEDSVSIIIHIICIQLK